MNDLVSRLLAAIEQLEKIARECGDEDDRRWKWSLLSETVRTESGDYVACGPWDGDVDSNYALHMVMNDPNVVLRRCAADRVILQQHRPINDAGWICGVCIEPGYIGFEYRSDWPTVNAPCPTLVALASAYGLSVEEETTHE